MASAVNCSLIHPILALHNPVAFFQAMQKQYSDPFVLKFPQLATTYVTGRADLTRNIFTAPLDQFEPAQPNPIAPLLGDKSLISIGGDYHLKIRKQLSPYLHGSGMQGYVETIHSITTEHVASWTGSRINLLDAMQAITLQVIVQLLFGVKDRMRRNEFTNAIQRYLFRYKPYLMLVPQFRVAVGQWSPWSRFLSAYRHLDSILETEIEQRLKLKPQVLAARIDLLSKILMSNDFNLKDANERTSLRDQLRTLLIAGHETTAITLTWAIYYVLSNEECQSRLREQILLNSRNEVEGLGQSEYLHNICQEAMRLFPVVPIVLRRLKKDFTLGSIQAKAGENVAVATLLLHRNPDCWPAPDSFNPDRFAGVSYSPYQYAPFGGGVRRCLGASFALLEMKHILGVLFSGAHLSLDGPLNISPRVQNITMGPRQNIYVYCKKS